MNSFGYDNRIIGRIKEKKRNLIKWKVYNIGAFWSFNRSVIFVAYVGYEQELIVTEFHQYSKCKIQDFAKLLKDKTSDIYRNLKKDEHLNKVAINDKPFIYSAIKRQIHRFRMKYIDAENLENEEELLKVIYESNQIKLPNEVQLSQPINKTALLFLIHLFEARLVSSPITCKRTIRDEINRLYYYDVERLPGDPDCEDRVPSYYQYRMY